MPLQTGSARRLACAAVAITAGVASAQWPVDGVLCNGRNGIGMISIGDAASGIEPTLAVSAKPNQSAGNVYRQSSTSVAVPIGGTANRRTYKWLSNAEDTVSEVEDYLIQSPLVTSWGAIVVVADNCTMTLMPDPAVSIDKADWLPEVKSWVPGVDLGYEKVFAGVAILNDVAYVLDKRDKALHAVQLTRFGFIEKGWSPIIFNNSHVDFDLDVSLLPNPVTNQLWVPLKGTLLGNMGIAAYIDLNLPTPVATYVPVPDADCRFPADYGSAVISDGQVVILGADTCGMNVFDNTGTNKFTTYPDQKFLFEYGEHSHPVFDPTSSQLYFMNWADTMKDNQYLCCLNTRGEQFRNCDNWPGQCLKIPELSRQPDPTGDWVYRWEWLAMGLWQRNGIMFIAASAAVLDKTIINGAQDLTSAIFAYDVANGRLISTHRFDGDQFNSAPLIVTGSSGSGVTQVYVSSTLGSIYAYDAGNLAKGPLWSSVDVAPIPADDLPQTTYSYLTVTPQGTILLTSTAGGADWEDEKAVYAIVNGIQGPPGASPPANDDSISPGAAVGVTVAVLGAAFAFGWVGYVKSPFVKVLVDEGVKTASGYAAQAKAAVSGYASVGSSYVGVKSGLLGGSGAGGSSSSAGSGSGYQGSWSGAASSYSSGEPSAPSGSSYQSIGTEL